MATNDMGPGPLKKARRLVKKITQKVTKGTFLEDSKKYPGEKNNPFARKGGTTKMKKYQPGGAIKKPLRKAQDGIEMNDDMINKSGSTGGYKKPMKIVRGASDVDKMYSDTTPGELPLMMMKKPTGYKTGGVTMKNMYKTGGMVNANAKLVAAKTVKKPAKPRSIAPKKAIPKAKYGMTIKSGGAKPKAMYGASMKPGSMMKKGGMMNKKSC